MDCILLVVLTAELPSLHTCDKMYQITLTALELCENQAGVKVSRPRARGPYCTAGVKVSRPRA
jgi:hypothetical protein